MPSPSIIAGPEGLSAEPTGDGHHPPALRVISRQPGGAPCPAYRTLGVWLTAEISIFFKPSYGGYTSESVSGTAGLPTTVLT